MGSKRGGHVELEAVTPALAYTIVEAAHLVRSSRSQLYKDIGRKRLRSMHNGDRHLISHDALVAYVDLLQDESDAETRWRR